MPPKRRYARYTFEDTQRALEQQQRQLGVEIVPNSSSRNGRRVGLRSSELDKLVGERDMHPVVILARSSHWYRFSLNAYWHGLDCAIVGTHDSCLEVPVLAMDDLEWYAPEKIRLEKSLAPGKGMSNPKAPMDCKTNPDLFEIKYRKTRYGHAVLIGALIRGRKDARDRLMTLPERTRFRIEAEVRHLRARRSGRPLLIWEPEELEHLDEQIDDLEQELIMARARRADREGRLIEELEQQLAMARARLKGEKN
jgi:hypothetical protein